MGGAGAGYNTIACRTKPIAVEVERAAKSLPLARNFPIVWFAQKIRCFQSSALIILHFMGLCSAVIMFIMLFAIVLANLEDGFRNPLTLPTLLQLCLS